MSFKNTTPTGRTEAAGGKVARKEKGASVKKSYKKKIKKRKEKVIKMK